MKDEIQKFFKGEVENSDEVLAKYSHDASIFEVRPELVVFPKDKEDIKNLVKWVNENKELYPKLSLTARCAGTDMSGGSVNESIIIDFTRHMNRLIGGPLPLDNPSFVDQKKKNLVSNLDNYPLVSSYITVEPGMFYRDFEKITLAKGLILPSYTASKSINAVGGMFGNNSAGEKTLKYGQTEKYVISSRVVFADGNEYEVVPLSKEGLNKKINQNDFEGNVYKNIYDLIQQNYEDIKHAKPNVHKNSSGYFLWNVLNPDSEKEYFNLNKLLVGSQGTLGIATEITFRVLPVREKSKLVVIFVNDLEPLGRLVDVILTLNPETLETYDDQTMKLAVKFFPDFLKNKGVKGMFKFMWSFLPEALMMLTSGFPKLIILAEFSGQTEEEIDKQCKALQEKISNFKLKVHITKSEMEANKYWDIRRESFALLRKHVKKMRTAPFIDDIIVRSEFLPKFIPELNAILKNYKLNYTLAGHAGDGNFHIIPLMDFSRPDLAKIILELSEKVYELIAKYHGSITAEHNDGFIRTPFLNKIYSKEILDIFKQVKNIFDIKVIFNPGKKVPILNGGGTKEYIANHIAYEHKAIHSS